MNGEDVFGSKIRVIYPTQNPTTTSSHTKLKEHGRPQTKGMQHLNGPLSSLGTQDSSSSIVPIDNTSTPIPITQQQEQKQTTRTPWKVESHPRFDFTQFDGEQSRLPSRGSQTQASSSDGEEELRISDEEEQECPPLNTVCTHVLIWRFKIHLNNWRGSLNSVGIVGY